MASETTTTPIRHRPKTLTVFAAAFLAGAAAAVGVNRVLDVQLAQRRPQVECEPIFVALRSLPQGSAVTVWDVALKDWPKAMLPGSAMRAGDTFEGYVLRHAVREGQPLLAVQLVRSGPSPATAVSEEAFTAPAPAAPAVTTSTQNDPWMPAATPPASAPGSAMVATPARDTTPSREATPTVSPRPTDIAAPPAPSIATVTPASPAPEPAETPIDEPSTSAPSTPATSTVAEKAEPTPAEAGSPTVADPTAGPADTASASGQPTLASDSMPAEVTESESVATDVASMPSVLTEDQNGTTTGDPRRTQAGRHLVVPERIALQADTSFTTPRPQPPGPPSASTPATTRERQVTPSTQQPQRRSQQAVQQRPPQQRSTQQQAPQQPANGRKPSTSQPQRQAQTQPSTDERTWGTMFPNVAAGIEAIGNQWTRVRSGNASQPTRR